MRHLYQNKRGFFVCASFISTTCKLKHCIYAKNSSIATLANILKQFSFKPSNLIVFSLITYLLRNLEFLQVQIEFLLQLAQIIVTNHFDCKLFTWIKRLAFSLLLLCHICFLIIIDSLKCNGLLHHPLLLHQLPQLPRLLHALRE